jgi:hypothetical protein
MSLDRKPIPWGVSFVNAGLFFLAGLMSLSFLSTTLGYSFAGVLLVVAAAAFVTAMRVAAGADRIGGRGRQALVRLAWVGNACFHGFLLYFAIVWGARLGWTMPWWGKVLALVLLVAALATARRPANRVGVPIALPLSLVIILCLLGWGRAEGWVRCDDYLRARAQDGVEILFPTTDDLAGCKPGEVFSVRRYPRKIWESPDGGRYVVTTTPSAEPPGAAGVPEDIYDGLFCELSADGTGRPHCVGGMEGKAHEIQESEPLDQLLSCAWAERAGHRTSSIFRLSRSASLAILGEHRMDGILAVNGFYQPKADEYHVFTDQNEPMRSVRASDFAEIPGLPIANSPGAIVYDAERDEGVMCGGVDAFAAFRLMPLSYRLLAREGNPLRYFWMSLGCDFDRAGRKVYTTIPSLGLLAVIDYDTGRVERTHFVGFALRSVAFDATRQRVYIADFLGGDVLAVDAATGEEIRRWFVGPYIRETLISRDGKKLLTTSHLGIGRIDLERQGHGHRRQTP